MFIKTDAGCLRQESQAHHVGLSDGIDGRVGGLGEQLGEVVEGLARHPRQTGQWHVLDSARKKEIQDRKMRRALQGKGTGAQADPFLPVHLASIQFCHFADPPFGAALPTHFLLKGGYN